jgi:4-hydroxybenzoate polyprenyltransferase
MSAAPAPALTAAAPLRRRLGAYLAERFPPVNYGLLIVAYTSSNHFLARALTEPGRPMGYDWGGLAAALALLGFFFHLRVFDEHKDYADDCRHHPHRVLQRGLVTLGQLRVLAGVALTLEAAAAAAAGWPAAVALALAVGFSVLMLKEFFARRWLKRHFLAYATSHMLIMPLLSLMVFSFSTRRYPWQAPFWYWVYAFVGFFVSFNWEVSRKIRAPEDEIEGVDTYTRLFGTYGAAYLVLAIRVVDTALVALVGLHLGLAAWFYLALVALFALCLVGFGQYRFATSRRTAQRMETYAGLYILAFDAILAVALAARFGFATEIP